MKSIYKSLPLCRVNNVFKQYFYIYLFIFSVPNAPKNLQKTFVSNTTVSLKWYAPPVLTGPLLFYRIVWKNGRSGGSEETPNNETFYTVKSLSPYDVYRFSVLAVSKAGAGESSEEIEVQTDVGGKRNCPFFNISILG